MSMGLKLMIGCAVIVAATAYMAYVGASSSWRYYLTVDECAADSAKFVGHRVRLSGRVAEGSLRVDEQAMQASFVLEGQQSRLATRCQGPLPDNLAEGIEVVVEGSLERPDLLRGDKVLTRCASKYESGEPAGERERDDLAEA